MNVKSVGVRAWVQRVLPFKSHKSIVYCAAHKLLYSYQFLVFVTWQIHDAISFRLVLIWMYAVIFIYNYFLRLIRNPPKVSSTPIQILLLHANFVFETDAQFTPYFFLIFNKIRCLFLNVTNLLQSKSTTWLHCAVSIPFDKVIS